MRKIISFFIILAGLQASAQDTTLNNLTNDMNTDGKQPTRVFDNVKLINTNTPELIGKGKMDFRVVHNFSDIAGTGGGAKSFFGLDAAADIKIGFQIGIGKKVDAIISRVKGSEAYHSLASRVTRILEFGLKYKPLQQMENDPSRPVSLAFFGSVAISTMKVPASYGNPNIADSAESNFQDFGDRMSQTLQFILARKFNKVSLQLSGTYVHRNRVGLGDQNSTFAFGLAGRIPFSNRVAFIFDWLHPFHSDATEQFYKSKPISQPGSVTGLYDPLGFGVEITTAGHIFSLNFTNATEILESRMIPRTVTRWHKGQFRWSFTISRTFVLWKDKSM